MGPPVYAQPVTPGFMSPLQGFAQPQSQIVQHPLDQQRVGPRLTARPYVGQLVWRCDEHRGVWQLDCITAIQSASEVTIELVEPSRQGVRRPKPWKIHWTTLYSDLSGYSVNPHTKQLVAPAIPLAY